MSDRFNIDSKAVKELAELLNETGLTEIEYEVDAGRIRVAKSPAPVAAAAPAAAPQALTATPVAAAPVEVKPLDHPGAVKSPMVGTVYLAPSPGSPTFVKPGDTVTKGDILLIIEAMKVMNPIRAPHAGRIVQMCINDADPVEFGTVLAIIE
jgi:acetyl-CoA carboxylase biotin carboxyl carrier protein